MIKAMIRKIDISHKTVFFITAFLVLLWVLLQVLDILLLLFLSFIFMSALAPLVQKLRRWRVPKLLAILIVFFSVILLFAGLIAIGLTPLINQTSSLTQRLAETVTTLLQSNLVDRSIIQDEFSQISRRVVDFILGFFENIIALATLLVITFYLLLDREKIESSFAALFADRKDQVEKLLGKLEDKLGAWLQGQIILSATVGVLYYLGLVILGVEFALPLAILGALMEVIPIIGPIIAAIPAVLIALTVSPLLALVVGGLYLVIQQVEGHVIVPQVMKRAVGLNPILVILAVTIGGRLLGIGGALLAVPIAVVVQVILQEGFKVDTDI